jgi:hypothetical protein
VQYTVTCAPKYPTQHFYTDVPKQRNHSLKYLWKSHVVCNFFRSMLLHICKKIYVRHVRYATYVRSLKMYLHSPTSTILVPPSSVIGSESDDCSLSDSGTKNYYKSVPSTLTTHASHFCYIHNFFKISERCQNHIYSIH